MTREWCSTVMLHFCQVFKTEPLVICSTKILADDNSSKTSVFKEMHMTQYLKHILGFWPHQVLNCKWYWAPCVFWPFVSTNRWPNAGWVACCFLWSQEKGWYHLLSFTVIHYTWVWLQLAAPLAKSSHAHTDLVSSLLKLNFPTSSCQKLNRKTLHQRVCVHLWQTLSRCTGKSCTHTQWKVQLSPKRLKQNMLEHIPGQDHFSSWLSQVERIIINHNRTQRENSGPGEFFFFFPENRTEQTVTLGN